MENTAVFFIFLILLFAMFYFLIIRPQRKRQQRHKELMDALMPGDRIITIGGIHGKIESITEENIILKVESGATIRMARNAVAYKQETSP
ncbi:MAG: preprotein translocase subunit YajC [Dehalococcoidales bacterium]|jgi:preprotein translocase subunit YajC